MRWRCMGLPGLLTNQSVLLFFSYAVRGVVGSSSRRCRAGAGNRLRAAGSARGRARYRHAPCMPCRRRAGVRAASDSWSAGTGIAGRSPVPVGGWPRTRLSPVQDSDAGRYGEATMRRAR